MTRNYEETRFNMNTKQREHIADWSFSVYPNDNRHFTVCRNGIVKTVKVKDDDEFIYCCQKTQIKARDGASGLFKFIDDSLFECSADCRSWQILRHCFFDCKAA